MRRDSSSNYQRDLPLGWDCDDFVTPHRYVVYFITDGEFVKIGFSSGLKRRINENQTGNPRKLRVLKVFECADEDHMKNVEQRFHDYFAPYRVRGEWFRISAYDIPDEIPPRIVGAEYVAWLLLTAAYKAIACKQLREIDNLKLQINPYQKLALQVMADHVLPTENIALHESVTAEKVISLYNAAIDKVAAERDIREPLSDNPKIQNQQIALIAKRAIQATLIEI